MKQSTCPPTPRIYIIKVTASFAPLGTRSFLSFWFPFSGHRVVRSLCSIREICSYWLGGSGSLGSYAWSTHRSGYRWWAAIFSHWTWITGMCFCFQRLVRVFNSHQLVSILTLLKALLKLRHTIENPHRAFLGIGHVVHLAILTLWGFLAAFGFMSLFTTLETSITSLTCCLSMTKPLTCRYVFS